jgi:hypothetical protein
MQPLKWELTGPSSVPTFLQLPVCCKGMTFASFVCLNNTLHCIFMPWHQVCRKQLDVLLHEAEESLVELSAFIGLAESRSE